MAKSNLLTVQEETKESLRRRKKHKGDDVDEPAKKPSALDENKNDQSSKSKKPRKRVSFA